MGRGSPDGRLTGQLLDEGFERLATALVEARAGALAVIGQDDEPIRPRGVGGRLGDQADDLVDPGDRVAGLRAVWAGVVSDLVVVDEVDVDVRRAAIHLLD